RLWLRGGAGVGAGDACAVPTGGAAAMKPGPALDERASGTIDPGVRKPQRPLRLVSALAAHSLRHEWILTLCLVIALAAVIAPLLVLLGLKHGTIETLRDRLVEDPVFRSEEHTSELQSREN